jgi:hypothetical protein
LASVFGAGFHSVAFNNSTKRPALRTEMINWQTPALIGLHRDPTVEARVRPFVHGLDLVGLGEYLLQVIGELPARGTVAIA